MPPRPRASLEIEICFSKLIKVASKHQTLGIRATVNPSARDNEAGRDASAAMPTAPESPRTKLARAGDGDAEIRGKGIIVTLGVVGSRPGRGRVTLARLAAVPPMG
jgi:hypothetical protein